MLYLVAAVRKDNLATRRCRSRHRAFIHRGWLSFPKTQSERGSVWLVACSESHERNRQRSLPRNQPWAQQSGRKLTLAVQATRTGDGEIPKPSHVTEIRRSSCFSSQPLQPRTPSLQPQEFQVQLLRRPRRVAQAFCVLRCAGWPAFGDPLALG